MYHLNMSSLFILQYRTFKVLKFLWKYENEIIDFKLMEINFNLDMNKWLFKSQSRIKT